MSGLGNNRDYKTSDRAARKGLARHFVRMTELQAQGLPREEASRQAYDEMMGRKPMQTFRNTSFTTRDYECRNVVACRAESQPAGNWAPAPHAALTGLTMLQREAGVEYWGYL